MSASTANGLLDKKLQLSCTNTLLRASVVMRVRPTHTHTHTKRRTSTIFCSLIILSLSFFVLVIGWTSQDMSEQVQPALSGRTPRTRALPVRNTNTDADGSRDVVPAPLSICSFLSLFTSLSFIYFPPFSFPKTIIPPTL